MHPFIKFYSNRPISHGFIAFQSFCVKKYKMATSGNFGNSIFAKNNRVPPLGEYYKILSESVQNFLSYHPET